MKRLALVNSELPCLIDDDDWEWASKYRWWLVNRGYASRSTTVARRPDGRTINKQLYLHREIIKAPRGRQVDHIDRNKLNNQRKNLRLCNNSQNHLNAMKRKTAFGGRPTSRYKGVSNKGHYKRSGKPRFTAQFNGKRLGYFNSERKAAKAYDAAAYAFSPNFAVLNFPI